MGCRAGHGVVGSQARYKVNRAPHHAIAQIRTSTELAGSSRCAPRRSLVIVRGVLCAWIWFTVALPARSHAQQVISLQPSVYESADLPFPGHPLKLSVRVLGTKNPQYTMRLLIVRDGRLIEQILDNVIVDDAGHLVYSAETNAPLAEITYQFILSGAPAVLAASPRVALRRPCIPDIRPIDTDLDPNLDLGAKLKALLQQSRALEAEVKNYEVAAKLIEELKALTEN